VVTINCDVPVKEKDSLLRQNEFLEVPYRIKGAFSTPSQSPVFY